MGHFARVENGIVTEVIVIANDVLGEDALSFPETEPIGQEFIREVLKLDGEWLQTSYNDSFRVRYAGVGFTFDPSIGEHGGFISAPPFPSWVLDEEYVWRAPTPYPVGSEGSYMWNEEAQEWQLVE